MDDERKDRHGTEERSTEGHAAGGAQDHREIRTTAGPRQAWAAWAEPDKIAGWFADRARGEPVPGGKLVHVFSSFGMELEYDVLEAEPGKLLVLQGRSPMGFEFRQEIRIEVEDGETVIHLTHSGFGDDADWGDEYEGIDSGWKLALALLRHYLENHFGKERTVFLVMRPTALSYDAAQPYFRGREGLRRWLVGDGSLEDLAPGDELRLTLRDGGTISGRVLADSGREIALSWDEIDGALELKIFPAGPEGRMVALRGSSWRLAEEEMQQLAAKLEPAVARLAEGVAS